jgi:hypothetical protein
MKAFPWINRMRHTLRPVVFAALIVSASEVAAQTNKGTDNSANAWYFACKAFAENQAVTAETNFCSGRERWRPSHEQRASSASKQTKIRLIGKRYDSDMTVIRPLGETRRRSNGRLLQPLPATTTSHADATARE